MAMMLFDSKNNAIDMKDQIDDLRSDESIIPNQAEFQDIIAQGGERNKYVLSEDEPILPGLSQIQDEEDE